MLDDGMTEVETFTCESCRGTFDKGWSDAEATAEAEELFPGIDVTDPSVAGIVCDGCFEYIMARARAEAPEMIGEGWRCYRTDSGMAVHVKPGCRCK